MGGYILDGYGSPHQFGSAAPLVGFAYFPRQDIARDLSGF